MLWQGGDGAHKQDLSQVIDGGISRSGGKVSTSSDFRVVKEEEMIRKWIVLGGRTGLNRLGSIWHQHTFPERSGERS
jgi:hypothetical protein